MMISLMSTKNIILFGQTGAGKSSVVNLMTGQQRARTSSGTERCTTHWEAHSIDIDGSIFRVFDTIDLQEYQLGMKEYLDAIENAYTLIKKLKDEGGIHLLLFCVRAGRFTSTIPNNYRLFYECLCEKKVPIVLVLTGLEREQRMDDWWTKYKSTFDKYDIVVDNHACITAIDGPDETQRKLYEESGRLVRNLVTHCTSTDDGYKVDDGSKGGKKSKWSNEWLKMFISKLLELLPGNHTMKKKDIVHVLTERCGMPQQAAEQLAKQIKLK